MTPLKVLIVDGNALCYSAYYTSGHLAYKEQGTGIIYGFFAQLQHICRTQQAANLVFCWDSRQSHRKRIFPAYKSNRKKSDPNLLACLKQFAMLRKEIIPRLGFKNNFHCTGFEADDLIASICRFPGPHIGQQYIVISGDQDLYQLLTEQVSIYKPAKKRLYTIHDFRQQYGIDPLWWVEVKALAGCQSDTVPGIPGIGEARALAYLKASAHERNQKIDCPAGRKIRERNLPLVALPFAGTPKFSVDLESTPSFAEWLLVCEEYNFQSFLRQSEVWEPIFSGLPPTNGLDRIKIGRKEK